MQGKVVIHLLITQPSVDLTFSTALEQGYGISMEFTNYIKGNPGARGPSAVEVSDIEPRDPQVQVWLNYAGESSEDPDKISSVDIIDHNGIDLKTQAQRNRIYEDRLTNTLIVTLTQQKTADLTYTFLPENFKQVALTATKGGSIKVQLIDNRAMEFRNVELNQIVEAAWNTALEQVEIHDPIVARAFYLHNGMSANRGSRTYNTAGFATRDPLFIFNATTGFYEYFDLKDITETEAVTIHADTSLLAQFSSDMAQACCHTKARINLRPLNLWPAVKEFTGLRLYGVGQFPIRYLMLSAISTFPMGLGDRYTLRPPNTVNYSFESYSCALKKIYGLIDIAALAGTTSFKYVNNTLTQLFLHNIRCNINASHLQVLNLESVTYWITNATNKSVITLTLTAGLFDQLPEQLIALASSKDITLLSA